MVSTQLLDYLYLKMPGTEAVTVTIKRGVNNDTTTTTSVSHAWMRDISRDDIAKGLVISAHGRRNPFEPDPVYQLPLQRQLVQQATVPKRQQDQQAPQQQPAPQRQPEEQPAVDAADQVTQSGIGVEQALKVVLSAVAQNNAQLQASIENSDLMKGYYNV